MRNTLFSIMADRTKHIHAQRSFHFLAECHKMLRGNDQSPDCHMGCLYVLMKKKTCGWQLTHNTLLHSPTGM